MLKIENRCFRWRASLFLALALVLALTSGLLSVRAEAPPPRWDIFADDFESGNLDAWRTVAAAHLQVMAAVGYGGSKALAVSVDPDESYVYQTDLARAAEAYLTFWFNPNGVVIPDEGTSWVPGKSIRIADIKGPAHWHPLVALRVRRPAGQGYKAYLEWRAPDGSHYDYGAGEFDLSEGWQKITIGYRRDDWVAAWVNDIQVRQVSGVSHNEAYGSIVEIGKASTTTGITATGTLLFDDVAFQLCVHHRLREHAPGDDLLGRDRLGFVEADGEDGILADNKRGVDDLDAGAAEADGGVAGQLGVHGGSGLGAGFALGREQALDHLPGLLDAGADIFQPALETTWERCGARSSSGMWAWPRSWSASSRAWPTMHARVHIAMTQNIGGSGATILTHTLIGAD